MEDFTLVSYSSTVYFDAPRAPAPIEPSSTGTYSIVPSEEPDTIEILFPASYSETKEVINKTTKPIEYSSTYSVDGEVPVTNELTVVDEGKVEDTRRGTYPTVEPFCPKRISN